MNTDDWWDTLYADDTETGHRDTWDTKTPRHDTATRQQDTTPGTGRTVRVTGRSGRLPDWRRGPRAVDTLDDPSDREQHDTAVRDSETPAQDTTKIRAERRRALRKEAAKRTESAEDADTDARDDSDDTGDNTEHDTPKGRRSVGKLVTGTFTKAQKAAVATADDIAARYQDDHDKVAAEHDRMAAAIDGLTGALQPVEPDRTWLPDWIGTVGAILIFNISASAVGHYTMGMLGYPDLSPAVVAYDIAENFTVGYHWSTSLIFGAMPPLTCWFLFDRRARSWSSTILRWLVRIPLASTAAGTLAATWYTIIHLATGATS